MPNYGGSPTLVNRSDKTAGVPIGAIIATALPVGTTAPSGYLICDGTSYTTAAFPQLFQIMQYGYGGSGANFNVPDFRNRFQRGHDSMDGRSNAAGLDLGPRSASAAGGSGSGNGSIENHMFQGHWHEVFTAGANGDNQGGQIQPPASVATQARLREMISDGVTTPQVAAETRMINVTVYFLVRAF